VTDLFAALVDGVPATGLPLSDGGLAYGDGLFETILFRDGRAALLAGHRARLTRDLARLGLVGVDIDALVAESQALAAGHATLVVKWIVTRGDGGRGYARALPPRPRRIVLAYAARGLPAASYRDGVAVADCAVRLATPAALAGAKHLNRLEQVMARAELVDSSVYDGLMYDSHDRLICATSANLVARIGGEVVTPGLDRCGVAGVARAALLSAAGFGPVVERDIGRAELPAIAELILTSAVRGVVPVRRWAGRNLTVGGLAARATAALAARGFTPCGAEAAR
jgi:4-amino-4-deoxychorismate lyase